MPHVASPWASLGNPGMFQRRSQQRLRIAQLCEAVQESSHLAIFSAHFNQKKCGFLCKKSCFGGSERKNNMVDSWKKNSVLLTHMTETKSSKNGIWLDLPDKIGTPWILLDVTWLMLWPSKSVIQVLHLMKKLDISRGSNQQTWGCQPYLGQTGLRPIERDLQYRQIPSGYLT